MVTNTTTKQAYDVSGGYVASYAIPFRYFATAHIKARLTFADGSTYDLVQGVDYSVSAPGASGTLTAITSWTAAQKLTIYRASPLLQETDYRNNDFLDAEVLERSFDMAVAMLQELYERSVRQVVVPIQDGTASLELPTRERRANNFLGFDSEGNAVAAAGAVPVIASEWMTTNLLSQDSQSAALTALGFSTFFKTLLNDASASDVLSTLGASAFGKTILQSAAANTKITGLDADTVSGFGIGAQAKVISGGDTATSFTGGGLYYGGSVTGAPDSGGWFYLCKYFNASSYNLIAFKSTSSATAMDIEINCKESGTFRGWKNIWTSDSDGNGGQPPAPKPRAATDSDIGQWTYRTVAHPSNFDLPGGGTWAYMAVRTNSTHVIEIKAGVAAGGAVVSNNNIGDSTTALCWRVV